jgi:hypothetical protein
MFGQGLNFGGLTGASGPFDADFLVIAGGGGGSTLAGGGGGAGGYRTSYGTSGGNSAAELSLSLSSGTTYSVEVGSGGPGSTVNGNDGTVGINSSFSGADITDVISNGGGLASHVAIGGVGGSGGGGGYGAPGTGGSGTSNQGFNGGNGGLGANSSTYPAGGGGGAGSAGTNAVSVGIGGNGGNGIASLITGVSVVRAGGGGGSGQNTPGTGGSGGGGSGGGVFSGTPTQSGTINTGSGGGGGSQNGTAVAGSGGSGTVILRYPTSKVSSYAVTGTLDTTANTAYPIANTAYYKLNGNANDSSGNGYNGTASNITYAAGRFGNAAVFNGSSSKIDLPVLGLGGGAARSVSAWINTTDNGALQFIFGSGTQAVYQVFAIHLTATGKVSVSYSASQLDSVGAPIKNNQWHHIAVTFSGGSTANTVLYVDGIAQNLTEVGTPGTVNTGNQNYAIGYNSPNPSYPFYFDGSIDQVRIFNSALSAGNVTSLYNESTVNESTDGTDSILQFIGGSGDITFS